VKKSGLLVAQSSNYTAQTFNQSNPLQSQDESYRFQELVPAAQQVTEPNPATSITPLPPYTMKKSGLLVAAQNPIADSTTPTFNHSHRRNESFTFPDFVPVGTVEPVHSPQPHVASSSFDQGQLAPSTLNIMKKSGLSIAQNTCVTPTVSYSDRRPPKNERYTFQEFVPVTQPATDCSQSIPSHMSNTYPTHVPQSSTEPIRRKIVRVYRPVAIVLPNDEADERIKTNEDVDEDKSESAQVEDNIKAKEDLMYGKQKDDMVARSEGQDECRVDQQDNSTHKGDGTVEVVRVENEDGIRQPAMLGY
jgi:hypothetical protein